MLDWIDWWIYSTLIFIKHHIKLNPIARLTKQHLQNICQKKGQILCRPNVDKLTAKCGLVSLACAWSIITISLCRIWEAAKVNLTYRNIWCELCLSFGLLLLCSLSLCRYAIHCETHFPIPSVNRGSQLIGIQVSQILSFSWHKLILTFPQQGRSDSWLH